MLVAEVVLIGVPTDRATVAHARLNGKRRSGGPGGAQLVFLAHVAEFGALRARDCFPLAVELVADDGAELIGTCEVLAFGPVDEYEGRIVDP